ncbi:hypothetical protein [Actinomadura sp. CNU-125]|uniref:hypothetical protein n=1 Tax=Actinomadura sp. CNU-125 TaxID=1904961 RepID=UPI0021CCD171|nr:hypothetical protein [Actinomadura sp. CNU-125]
MNWRNLYGAGVPGEIEPDAGSVLQMFRIRAGRRPDAPQLHYFGTTLDRAAVDRLSDALAAGLERRGVGPATASRSPCRTRPSASSPSSPCGSCARRSSR